jgi:hypothetical protein
MSELLVSWDFDGGIKCQDTAMTRISRSFKAELRFEPHLRLT